MKTARAADKMRTPLFLMRRSWFDEPALRRFVLRQARHERIEGLGTNGFGKPFALSLSKGEFYFVGRAKSFPIVTCVTS